MTKLKALGIGEIVLDKTCVLSLYPIEGIKVKPREVTHSLGGPVVSALILLSKLGVECTLVASIGQDMYGEEVRKKLKQYNISLMPQLQAVTKVNTVLVNSTNASRTIIKDHVAHSPLKHIDKRLVQQSDIIFFDRHEPLAFKEVVKIKKKQTKIVFDPSTEVSEKIFQLLRLTDHVILPVESLQTILPTENLLTKLQYLFQKLGKAIIITLGDKGSLLYEGDKIELQPAYNVHAVDTLGAGDVFRGAFGYALLKGHSVKQSVEFANRVAALQCTKIGNGIAIPTKDEINKFEKFAIKKQINMSDIIQMVNTN